MERKLPPIVNGFSSESFRQTLARMHLMGKDKNFQAKKHTSWQLQGKYHEVIN